jgi:hypothetical protein
MAKKLQKEKLGNSMLERKHKRKKKKKKKKKVNYSKPTCSLARFNIAYP